MRTLDQYPGGLASTIRRTSTTWTNQETNSTSGGEKQRGIVTYGLSANRQNPFAGATHAAIFNTFRRTKSQIFFWLPPMLAGYYIMDWAVHRSEYLNSKAGRAEFGDEEE
ncbi:Cytochrome b-c1 complex subunit 8 [Fusarium duplospermum]|uniref:Cytochrome b-c1 complex subunit 8 n=1 Tax=Fusarium duplospermum TaxID=1325734 RepID=A0A428PS65_9HYPO|nr:Cytochrome b-c1 complex subunit 8 [Fusarium duplospermum]